MNLQEHIQPLTPVAAAKLQAIVSDLKASAAHPDRRYVALRRLQEVVPNAPPETLASLLLKSLQDSGQIKNFAGPNLSPEMEKLRAQASLANSMKAMELFSDIVKHQHGIVSRFAQGAR